MKLALEARLKLQKSLPSPPGVATQIIELANNPDSTMASLADIISLDPALTAKIMRIANSPLYARRRQSNNLRQALVLLGLNATITLALSFCLAGSLRQGRAKGLDLDYFWRRSVLAAIGARSLGLALGRSDSEELFLAGLLQDIGMLALDRAMPGLYDPESRIQYRHDLVCEIERQALGNDHVEVGAWLLQEWRLPEHFSQAVAASHGENTSDGDENRREFVRCVATSGAIADLWLAADRSDDSFAPVAAQAKGLLGIDGEAVGAMLQQMRGEIGEAEVLFEINLVAAQEADLLIEQAQELMLVRNLRLFEETRNLRQTVDLFQSRAQELEERSQRDALTGLHNRAYLDPLLEAEFAHAKEQRSPLSLIFADIDRFKRINDTLGHQAGDVGLQRSAEMLRTCIRGNDLLARYGGEEFVIVLPGSDQRQAAVVAERVLLRFRETRHTIGEDSEVSVTISLGIAAQSRENEFEQVWGLVRAADRALYQAKESGRDRWVAYDPRHDGLAAKD